MPTTLLHAAALAASAAAALRTAATRGAALLAPPAAKAVAGGAALLGAALAAAPATPAACAAASDAVLRSVVRSPFTSRRVAGLYTVELPAPRADAPALVLLHGFGNGSAMYGLVLDLLAPHFRVFAVDANGCGASERPAWPRGATTVAEAEAFFIDSLDTWRNVMGLRDTVLVGHSLGGYLAGAYALRHPMRVRHLVLASPVGVPPPPPPEADTTTAWRESSWAAGLLARAWESGVTPQTLIKAAGAWGEPRVRAALGGRFGDLMSRSSRARGLDREALSRYLYLINSNDDSGERALSALLAFGAMARDPLGPRLARAAASAPFPPVTFIYGAVGRDWMLRVSPGEDTASALRARGCRSEVLYLQAAGHNLQVESPEKFAEAIILRCA